MTKQYLHVLDEDKFLTEGIALLYRNEKIGDQYKYSLYRGEDCLFDNTKPIAKGITAFFYTEVWSSIKVPLKTKLRRKEYFDTYEYYETYYNISSPIRDYLGTSLIIKNLEWRMLQTYIIEERKCLRMLMNKPYKFYNKSSSDDEKYIKNEVKEYVMGYIWWLNNL